MYEKLFPSLTMVFLTKYGWFSFIVLSSIGNGFLVLFKALLDFPIVSRTTNVS